jgi:hypothetical protein
MYGWACASCRRLARTQCRVPSSSMPSPIVAVRSEKAKGYCFLFVRTYGDPSSTRYQGLRLDSSGRPRLLEMVPRRQGHGGQLKLVLDRVALFCRNPLPLTDGTRTQWVRVEANQSLPMSQNLIRTRTHTHTWVYILSHTHTHLGKKTRG